MVFLFFQFGFRSSRSTADLLKVVSDRIARTFNKSDKAFVRVWFVGILHKLKSCRISGQIFGLISFFLSNR